jgi:hypothetical protein|tara:strand:+ start:7353 stop:7781 length:429 start_codon:yes stop_codon:yes gene_type:complete
MSDDVIKALLNTMTDEQKAELLNSLAGSLKKDTDAEPAPKQEETVSSTPRSNVTEDFRVVRDNDLDKRKTPVRARKNQWVDDGENRDPDFDPQKFERMGKTSRNRGKVKKRTVECHVCGRDFQVNPALVHGEYFRCNRCTGR